MKTFKNKAEFSKFLKENPDPLGVQKNGGFKEYTWDEVAQHNALPSVWSVYNGTVYDITMYINVHPGGKKILEKVFGKDMTALFNKFHGYVNIDAIIGPLKIGTISKDKNLAKKKDIPIQEEDENEHSD